jgi:hypothetical protein
MLKLKIMKEKSRQKLIDAIHEYASDELDEKDWFNIAKESDKQLIDRVINILSWYHEEYNKL